MTRQEFDRRFAATLENTEGFTVEQLAKINDAVFAQAADLPFEDDAGIYTKSHMDHLFKTAFSAF